jgi:hypothetical protein
MAGKIQKADHGLIIAGGCDDRCGRGSCVREVRLLEKVLFEPAKLLVDQIMV